MFGLGVKGMAGVRAASKSAFSRKVLDAVQTTGPRLTIGPLQIQVATLKATYGEQYPYSKPFDYQNKKFNWMYEMFDDTLGRMNENSKVILVEGSVAVGKNDFAERLAKCFDLKYFPSVPDDGVYVQPHSQFDLRILNDMLPFGAQFYDLQMFLADSDPSRGTLGKLFLPWYQQKYWQYVLAMEHLLSTGQGVVIPRSIFSESAYLETFKKLGWIKPKFARHYQECVDATLCEVLKPHLTIYLDAPVNVIRERITKENNPVHANAPNLSDKYLSALEATFKNSFLPKMRSSGEVLEVDWMEVADDMDMDAIAEEIQQVNLEAEDSEDTRFHDWYQCTDEYLAGERKVMSHHGDHINEMFTLPPVNEDDCPEVSMTPDDHEQYTKVVLRHPLLKYDFRYHPDFTNAAMKLW